MELTGTLVMGAVACYLLLWWRDRSLKRVRILETEAILSKAGREAEVILRDARLLASQESIQLRQHIEESFAARRLERAELEKRLGEREGLINSQLQRIVEAEKALLLQKDEVKQTQQEAMKREVEASERLKQVREQLQIVSGLSEFEAREALLRRVEQEALQHANTLSRHIVEEAKARAEEKARQIICIAIQRYAGSQTIDNTTASIALNGDEIKGRIIGREGRNIRAFEAATGVTVLIEDAPAAVLLSGFDPVRREVAREAMVRLIADGRIHPTRIEEVVGLVNQEMNESITRLGEDAVRRTGLPPMQIEVVKLLGRLHFRRSYCQNILEHSIEVAHLVGLMAAEMGLDVQTAKRVGLLHDIGKAVDHEIEGPHAVTGAEIIKRHGELEPVVNGVASHHNDVPAIGPWGSLVSAADAISASRPGARSESMSTYLRRIEDLEKIATSCAGVEKAYALQAGRELRVFVQPGEINDDQAYALARSLATRVESELQYPGQIKITVIRETRCIEVAK
ncbi:MAG: ribonuclease Y [Verrucomicrobia bacterium]|nr:ribonuclease Y [Verrucomicrobiota bacterium]